MGKEFLGYYRYLSRSACFQFHFPPSPPSGSTISHAQPRCASIRGYDHNTTDWTTPILIITITIITIIKRKITFATKSHDIINVFISDSLSFGFMRSASMFTFSPSLPLSAWTLKNPFLVVHCSSIKFVHIMDILIIY